MKSILFDSHAILKYSQDEKGADIVERLLHKAETASIKAYMSEINLGEVYYQTIRKIGLESAQAYIEQLTQLPFEIIAPSSEIIMKASEIKAQHTISFADCFAVATALQFSAAVVTGDPEFKKVKNFVEIIWV
ncbi:MAG: type II toxin-antitoxin system VapC family toxin [Desulfobacterales bacterium]|nr:MAG: type II toxin-antitoxin system VapC family toxin [Desulfobacterales bacterium]